ncbi:SIR2 family protein [Streptococcus salivarius]|uniref:SIR2 family protein n=1 Tax=Streptococcus TaxID=1301 RepID=UPI0025F3D54F|nr:SIR2 family protein [Streptococcus sp.]
MMVKVKGKFIEGCKECNNAKDFMLPEDVIQAVIKGDLVLFCGAGISTESKKVMPTSFYTDIKDELVIKNHIEVDENLSFSKLMSLFCENVVNGRKELFKRINSRFQMIENFPELYRIASEFHKEVAKIPQIGTVITTNWDTLFEDNCDMFPIIYNEDVALWDTFEKRVFKIHGSIKNIGSIIATEEDYENCYQKLSTKPIGDRLKTILSTKTVVFVGFSFGDEDLNKIIEILSDDLGQFANQFYLVTIDEKWLEKHPKNIIPIITDGTFFVKSLKNELIQQGTLIDSKVYRFAEEANKILINAHLSWMDDTKFHEILQEYPELLLTIAYQDGLIHAFQFSIADEKSGRILIPNYTYQVAQSYLYLCNQRMSENEYLRAYYDIGYSDGFLALELFASGKNEDALLPPMFYFNGKKFDDLESLLSYLKNNRNQKIYKYCKEKVTLYKNGDIPHFMPWYC